MATACTSTLSALNLCRSFGFNTAVEEACKEACVAVRTACLSRGELRTEWGGDRQADGTQRVSDKKALTRTLGFAFGSFSAQEKLDVGTF